MSEVSGQAVAVLPEEDIVRVEKTKLSDLWTKEDWLAVWIGFIVIAIAAISVITNTFDFSATKFSTWGNGVSPLEQLNGKFFIHLLLTSVVLGVLFTVGNRLRGIKVKEYIPAFIALFALAIIVRFISAEYTLNRYLEWAFWALIVGLAVANTVGVPKWLKPAVQTEYYIKAGLVIMGFSVLFSNIINFGLYGLGIAWLVTPVVIIFMWFFGTRVLKIDNKPFVITVATATSVCGTSAAIAVGAASKAKKNDLSLAVSISIIFAASLLASFVFQPLLGKEAVSGINKVLDQYKNWAFVLAFTSIGLDTNFREIKEQFQGGKPLVLYVVGQLFNIVLTFAAVYLLLSGKFIPLPALQ